MVTGAVCELIIGIKTDPQFGLALVIGAGGILTELLKDAATLLLPAAAPRSSMRWARLKSGRLIDGFRGRSGDREAVIAAIKAVARFAEAHARYLEELDVNPLMVLPPGQGAVAVDALIRMRDRRNRGVNMPDVIKVERRGTVLEVMIDRPKANAIDAATSRIMGEVFAGFRDDPDLRVAILTAAGEKFFCPGWDFKAAAAGESPGYRLRRRRFRRLAGAARASTSR